MMTAVVTRLVALIWLLLPSYLLAQAGDIKACQNFGCKRQKTLKLSHKEIRRLGAQFRPKAKTPAKERAQIAKAIALMERTVGPKAGTKRDKAENLGAGEPGQLDCIAESRNSQSYLRFFQRQGWLRWHKVDKRVKRNPWLFDVHWTATIKERKSGRVYVVDSWFLPNGQSPQIISLEAWLKKRKVD
jgi:hypothetical protein